MNEYAAKGLATQMAAERATEIVRRSFTDDPRRLRRIHRRSDVGYEFDIDLFDALWRSQDGKCAICHTDAENQSQLQIDHNHETGEIRGLLCVNCNAGLGHFRDESALLALAIVYLSMPSAAERICGGTFAPPLASKGGTPR